MFPIVGLAGTAAADPVRITVEFTVTGDPLDPDFASATGAGSFSIVAVPPVGGGLLADNTNGLAADVFQFSWAGTTWSTADADVIHLRFDDEGTMTAWNAGAALTGLPAVSFARFPDFIVGSCGFCPESTFVYTTPRSLELGIFGGQVTRVGVTQSSVDPDPIPEPMSMILVGSGMLGLVGARHRRRL